MGLSQSLMEDLLLRRAVLEGRTPMTTLADRLHVSINVVEALLNEMRQRKLIEYDGMEGRAYLISVTEAGRALSSQRSQESRYAGPMPVSLDLYRQVVTAQRPVLQLNRSMLARSFSDLVISPDLLDQLGPAIHGTGAIFLYGPPGTGKSSVAERVVRAYDDTVFIPHCIAVDGQIVSVFDPTLHEPVEEQPRGTDRRWVLCKRPAVVAGGELHAGMLDLQLDRDTGVYIAPLQLKANNGVLVIDDFGRQAMTPDALLNRWIVPLDRGVDYLTLHGRKLEVPFEVKAVLSTNLDPSDLGDEAFFRRIHNKVYIGACTDDQFDWILVRVAEKHRIEVDAGRATGGDRRVARHGVEDAGGLQHVVDIDRGAGDMLDRAVMRQRLAYDRQRPFARADVAGVHLRPPRAGRRGASGSTRCRPPRSAPCRGGHGRSRSGSGRWRDDRRSG